MNGITPKPSLSDRCFWMGFRSDCRVRIVRAAHSAHGTRSFTMRRRASLTCRSCIWLKNKRESAFTTARFQKLLCSGSITVTRSTIRRCFACGKHNSVISLTVRRPSLINSSSQRNRNGNGLAGLCFCSRMATKARARSIRARGWSAFCRRAQRIIFRSVILLPQPSIFMYCGAR